MTERTPHEEFLRELTRERFGRPVRAWHVQPATPEQLTELVREVVPYHVDRDGIVVIQESA